MIKIREYIASITKFGGAAEKPDCSVVIVNYNGGNLFLKLIEQLACRDNDAKLEIVVVDNNSADNSIRKAEHIFKSCNRYSAAKIIKLKRNYGPDIAYNIGVLLSSSDYVILINNDVLFDNNFSFKKLLLFFRRMGRFKIGAATVMIRKLKEPHIIDSAGTIVDELLYSIEYGMGDYAEKSSYNKVYMIGSVPLVFMLVPRKLYIKTGMLDPYYFAGYEDLDLSLRIQLAGYRLIYLPYFVIYHLRGGTSGKSSFKPLIAYLFARGYFFNVFTYMDPLKAFIAVFVRLILMFGESIIRRDPRYVYLGWLKPLASVLRSRYFGLKRRLVSRIREREGRLWLYRGLVLKALLRGNLRE